jgi:hypothetical protein
MFANNLTLLSVDLRHSFRAASTMASKESNMPPAFCFSKSILQRERRAAIAALRKICEDFGDNDWSDDTPLVVIISQHLAPHLAVDASKIEWLYLPCASTKTTLAEASEDVTEHSPPLISHSDGRMFERRLIELTPNRNGFAGNVTYGAARNTAVLVAECVKRLQAAESESADAADEPIFIESQQ